MKLIARLLYRITANRPTRLIKIEGRPYMERYFIGQLLGLTIYLHRFVREESQDTPELAVITDLRTEDEADWVRAMRGLVIHVSRPEGTSNIQHTTNQPIVMDQKDSYLLNNGTSEDLGKTVCAIVGAWITANKASASQKPHKGAA